MMIREIASEKNLFNLLEEFGYDVVDVARKLRVKDMLMSVADFMDQYMNGGLHHKYYQKIANICSEWYISQLDDTGLAFVAA